MEDWTLGQHRDPGELRETHGFEKLQLNLSWGFDLTNESLSVEVNNAVLSYSVAEPKARGAVFTKPEVVNFILDLVGYTSQNTLTDKSILEPSFGAGDFLIPIVDRLLGSIPRGLSGKNLEELLKPRVCAVEVSEEAHSVLRPRLRSVFQSRTHLSHCRVDSILNAWLVNYDFLLTELPCQFDFVVGNPPYLRQESIPSALLSEYRSRYKTMYDRADLYIPFFERSIRELVPGGRCSFICTNRWLKNKYGTKLRQFMAASGALTAYIDLVGADAFSREVVTYPAITLFEKWMDLGRQDRDTPTTAIVIRPEVSKLQSLARPIQSNTESDIVLRIRGATPPNAPWLLDIPEELTLLRQLESEHIPIEDDGCTVSIGVATGRDDVYIGYYNSLPVERARKLPLAMTKDLRSGELSWRGMGIVNPFEPDGSIASLDKYPRFKKYLTTHETSIRGRNVAKRNAKSWYRTIDKIHHELTGTPKLLIPDIKGGSTVVYDKGEFYPHHNLYYVTTEEWDIQALQTVLKSSIATFFVGSYCAKMSGDYLRFQAQYIRRIHLPRWRDISEPTRRQLHALAGSQSIQDIDSAVWDAYNLKRSEIEVVTKAAMRHRRSQQ